MPWFSDRPIASRFIGAALLATLVAGCSTREPIEEPAPVPEIETTVELDSVWTMDVGDGHGEQFLYLTPLNTGELIYVAAANGDVYAVQAENGKVEWYQELDRQVFAGLGGDREQLYLVTRDAQLVALSRDNGDVTWEEPLPNEVLAMPQSNGDIVVIQTTDGKVLAFDTASGELNWQYDGVVPVLSIRAASPPLVGSELVLAGFANGKLMALSAENGQPAWQYEVGQAQGRTELERLVDVTSQPLILENAALVVGYQGKLALVDLRNGEEIWSRSASSLHSPMIGAGNLYVSSANGDIIAYQGSNRRELWTQDRLSWRQTTQPVVYGDYLLVGDFEGYIHMLSLEDGSLQGQLEFDDEGLRVPAQRLRDGKLLVFGNSGKLSVLELKESD